MRILISLSWPKGPGGWPASLAGSNYFEIRSQGLVWRRRRSESCECLTASGNLNLNWAQAAEGLGPGHCQACLTGRLRSLQDSRWCSGNHSRAWLRLPLATSTGPRPLKIVMDVRKLKFTKCHCLVSHVNLLVKRNFLISCISVYMVSHVKS